MPEPSGRTRQDHRAPASGAPRAACRRSRAGRPPGRIASAFAPSSFALASTCRIAFASGELAASGIPGGRHGPGDLERRSRRRDHPRLPALGTERAASSTSSSIASASAPRSRPARSGDSRVLARPSDFTGSAIARMGSQTSRAPAVPSRPPIEEARERNPGTRRRRRWWCRRSGSGSACRTSTWTGSRGPVRRSSPATTSPTWTPSRTATP